MPACKRGGGRAGCDRAGCDSCLLAEKPRAPLQQRRQKTKQEQKQTNAVTNLNNQRQVCTNRSLKPCHGSMVGGGVLDYYYLSSSHENEELNISTNPKKQIKKCFWSRSPYAINSPEKILQYKKCYPHVGRSTGQTILSQNESAAPTGGIVGVPSTQPLAWRRANILNAAAAAPTPAPPPPPPPPAPPVPADRPPPI